MSALAKVSPAALIPAATGALAQLQPVMVQTQKSVQELTATVMRTTDSYEKRCQQLEAENIVLKEQIQTDRAAAEARQAAQDKLMKAMQRTMAAMGKRLSKVEGVASYMRPTIQAMVAQGGAFSNLDFPGKDKVVAARKPILQAQIAANKGTPRPPGMGNLRRNYDLNSELTALEAEAAGIAAFEARTKTKV